MIYKSPHNPTLLVLSPEESLEDLKTLLKNNIEDLPERSYCHLTPGVESILEDRYRLESHGLHYKMTLTDTSAISKFDTSEVEQLLPAHAEEVKMFYAQSYPGNWFDQRMLETGMYYCLRRNERIVNIAGIHVYSEKYKVAALGNITTLPEFRGKGFCSSVTAKLCLELLNTTGTIGLNVKSDNVAAIHCYEKLGFTITTDYMEYMVCRK